MVLAENAVDRNGRVLLKAGTELTEKHLKVFKTWGLTEANIEGISREDVVDSVAEQVDPQLLEEVDQRLRVLFQHVDLEHPAMAELFRLRKLACAVKGAQGN
jgi:hypothetical protein